ncbi:PD-(D/E)XK nuclease family protein [Candidatus Woesearchaeota archaeon]|nr:PD-(D/E)XK nuclease family protein [Candidatus Woesearchaeota archaeon]
MIQQVSLNHGAVPYEYMIHKAKLDSLTAERFSSLKSFLREMMGSCPSEPFFEGPRSSKLKFSMGIEPRRVENHEVIHLARSGLEWNRFRTAHSNVQGFMLSHDHKTVAVEVPLWLSPFECDEGLQAKFRERFQEEGPLSGHIDVLRIEDGKIWIWDYKPKADKEKYATTQTYFYALMLSKRTGIPLDNFMCGYFDDKSCFVFKPDVKYLRERQLVIKQ